MNNSLGNWAPFVSNGQPSTNSNTTNFTGGPWTFTETARTSGASQTFTITPGNSTGQTASTEIIGFDWDTFTRTWATGAITTQREVTLNGPTYAFAGASTITTAATLFVSSPIAGTNATLTSSYAAWFQANAVSGTEKIALFDVSDAPGFGLSIENMAGGAATIYPSIIGTGSSTNGLLIVGSAENDSSATVGILDFRARIGASTNPSVKALLYLRRNSTIISTWNFAGKQSHAPAAHTSGAVGAFLLTPPADTGQTASTEISSFRVATHTRTWATGALTTNREYLFEAPTYAFAAASTITNAATVAITAAPIAGTNATITNSYALWCAGRARFDSNVIIGATQAGATAANGVLALGNGATAPTTSVDLVQLYAVDLSAGNATLGLFTETAVAVDAGVASTHSLTVKINGTNYRILLAS